MKNDHILQLLHINLASTGIQDSHLAQPWQVDMFQCQINEIFQEEPASLQKEP